MLKKLRLITLTVSSSLLLVFMLCLGAYNTEDREVRIGLPPHYEFPKGFIVGISFSLGFLSGGLIASLSKSSEKNNT